MASTFLQPYKIVITRYFFPVLYFKILRKVYGIYDQIFGTCASINNKNHNYKPGKSFITQNYLLILWKKNTGKKVITQGKLRENTGNFISAGMWPPCRDMRPQCMRLYIVKQCNVDCSNTRNVVLVSIVECLPVFGELQFVFQLPLQCQTCIIKQDSYTCIFRTVKCKPPNHA